MRCSGLPTLGPVIGAAVLLALASLAQAQDQSIDDIMLKAQRGESDDNFCSRVNWPTTNPQEEHNFLEKAYVGLSEAAKFSSGACSYTRVDEVYQGAHGKCVRYTWWACQAGFTCALGESAFCKTERGTFDRLK